MLDQKDLEVLRTMMTEIVTQSENRMLQKMDEKITASEERMLHSVDEKLTASENRMLQKMDEKLTHSENLILNELDRVQEHLETDVQKVQKNLEELQQYYRITKLENDNTSLLLKMYNNMQKEIEELKAKIA